jgi:hypothetical protein
MRFCKRKKLRWQLLASVFLFCICALFCQAEIASVSEQASQAQLDHLKNALERSAVHCYAVEGAYPESLDYLKEHYGITWDESKYVVDYEIFGSNLKPVITVIPLNGQEVPQ